MIKEALQYVVGLSETKITEIDGKKYADKPLIRMDYAPKAKAIKMTTLRSLVDYIKSKADTMSDQMIVHVVSPTQVNLFSNLDSDRIRECMVEVHAELPEFPFNKFVDHEDFIIGVQAKFIPNNDSDLLLKFAGTVEGGTIADYGDDGVSQKATVKTGLAPKSDAIIPSPVTLKPYRTFTEVEQPESQFVFRMKEDKYDGVQCALFEADGGAWKLHAMESIQEYLEEQLKGVDGFTIIS